MGPFYIFKREGVRFSHDHWFPFGSRFHSIHDGPSPCRETLVNTAVLNATIKYSEAYRVTQGLHEKGIFRQCSWQLESHKSQMLILLWTNSNTKRRLTEEAVWIVEIAGSLYHFQVTQVMVKPDHDGSNFRIHFRRVERG